MSLEGIISIAIAVLGVGIGIPSLIVALSRKKYPKRMEFYVLDLVRIISPLVHKYDSIKLLHNDKETQNVSFLRGMFVCSGDEDVILKPEGNNRGLRVSLPLGYHWLEVHPQEGTNGLKVDCKIDEKRAGVMYITSDLFKRDEAFTFDAYIEGGDNDRLATKNIKVSHRLLNAGKIETRRVNLFGIMSKKRKLWLFGMIYAMIILLGCLSTFGLLYDRPIRYVDKNNTESIYSAMLAKTDTVAISKGGHGMNPWEQEYMSIEDFKQNYDMYTQCPEKTAWDVMIVVVFPICVCVFLVSVFIFMIASYRRQKKVVDMYCKISGVKVQEN